ncbi:major facilitator superfamily domain-containing protein [Aspergillus bertholletiae]|uniref:Major facilitator superfamily domain-containing protein n=1 Tax=Aspergillus bertholletiae TaxID=1226010 RepID=A0A5N7BB42_9EURO|nr:major facilitator superfamily domain-containing protein [Aspergillus bertholletiae]
MSKQVWGYGWRSSTFFIVTALGIALFTDSFLSSFIAPIVPHMVENRAGLDPSYTQTVTSWLLAENAMVSVILRIPVGHFADKSASKLKWLLWALVASFLGTICISLETSLLVLFASRLVQAVAETIIWVVGVAVVGELVPIHHIGKAYTTIFTASSAGNSIGPMLSGALYQLAGYWPAWSSAFAILSTDIIFRLLIVQKPHLKEADGFTDNSASEIDADSELASFLGGPGGRHSPPPNDNNAPNFYICLLCKRVFIGGLYCAFMYSLLDTTFTATLTLHVRDTFHWGGMGSGLMFATLQIPRMILSPLCGWLKDRIGSRIPLFLAFTTLTPLVWLLGVPGNASFPWANADGRGPALYVLTMGLIGISSSFLSGAGSIEAAVVTNELQKEYPRAFGRNGGNSRALAMTGVAYTLGSFTGPILAGSLHENYGYYVMNSVVAGICAASTVVVFFCLRPTAGRCEIV